MGSQRVRHDWANFTSLGCIRWKKWNEGQENMPGDQCVRTPPQSRWQVMVTETRMLAGGCRDAKGKIQEIYRTENWKTSWLRGCERWHQADAKDDVQGFELNQPSQQNYHFLRTGIMLEEKKFGGKILNIISDLCSLRRSLSPSGGNGKSAFAYTEAED